MKQIRLSKSTITKDDKDAVLRALDQGYLGMGSFVREFEEDLSQFFGRTAICVNTGTSALQLALQAIGIGEGDEVLVQSLTYLSSFQAISASGALPVACEVLADNLTIDLADARKRLTKNTKAIMPMHYSGNPGDLDAVYQFAKKHNLRVVEDAAHAFGSIYKGRKIGSFGDMVCFSFDGIKNITSGEGGAIVSSDQTALDKIKDLRLLGVQKDTDKRYAGQRSWDFEVIEQGWRYHMSNIMAAIGKSQLSRFEKTADTRKKLAKIYSRELKQIAGLQLLNCDYDEVVPHIFVVKVSNGKRDFLKNHLEANGIQTGIHYKPNHLLAYYKSKKNVSLPVTEIIYDQILTLPLHQELDNNELDFICQSIYKHLVT